MKEEVGKRITEIRKEMELNKEKLARKIGISGQFLGMVEKGKSSLSYDNLKKLCDVTGYSADYILFGIDNSYKKRTKQTIEQLEDRQLKEAFIILDKIAMFIRNNDIA